MPTNPRSTKLSELLAWANHRLIEIEQTISALADQEPDGLLKWGMPLAEATEARNALGHAPSLQPEPTPDPPDLAATPERILAIATSVNRALITASGQTKTEDKVACLGASNHLDRLCDLLE